MYQSRSLSNTDVDIKETSVTLGVEPSTPWTSKSDPSKS